VTEAQHWVSFDGMTWPNPDDPTEVQWRIQYGNPAREDLAAAVSFMAAYSQLIRLPRRTREARIRSIRKATEAQR